MVPLIFQVFKGKEDFLALLLANSVKREGTLFKKEQGVYRGSEWDCYLGKNG